MNVKTTYRPNLAAACNECYERNSIIVAINNMFTLVQVYYVYLE